METGSPLMPDTTTRKKWDAETGGPDQRSRKLLQNILGQSAVVPSVEGPVSEQELGCTRMIQETVRQDLGLELHSDHGITTAVTYDRHKDPATGQEMVTQTWAVWLEKSSPRDEYGKNGDPAVLFFRPAFADETVSVATLFGPMTSYGVVYTEKGDVGGKKLFPIRVEGDAQQGLTMKYISEGSEEYEAVMGEAARFIENYNNRNNNTER